MKCGPRTRAGNQLGIAASYVSIPTQPSKEYFTGGVYPDVYDKQSKNNEEEEDPQNWLIWWAELLGVSP